MSYLLVIGSEPRVVQVRPGTWVVRPGRSAFLLREMSPEEMAGKVPRVAPARGKTRALLDQMASEEEMVFFGGRYRVVVTGSAWKNAVLRNRLLSVICSAHSPVDDPPMAIGRWARFWAWVHDRFWDRSSPRPARAR